LLQELAELRAAQENADAMLADPETKTIDAPGPDDDKTAGASVNQVMPDTEKIKGEAEHEV